MIAWDLLRRIVAAWDASMDDWSEEWQLGYEALVDEARAFLAQPVPEEGEQRGRVQPAAPEEANRG